MNTPSRRNIRYAVTDHTTFNGAVNSQIRFVDSESRDGDGADCINFQHGPKDDLGKQNAKSQMSGTPSTLHFNLATHDMS